MLGKKSQDEALLTLVERKTRKKIIRRISNKDALAVDVALQAVFDEYQEKPQIIFKSITSDNGSEFSELAALDKTKQIKVYFAHPYASWERGSNECHNGLIHRFIKNGQFIHSTRTNTLMTRKYLDFLGTGLINLFQRVG